MQDGDDAARPTLTGILLPEVQQLVDRLVAQGFPGWKSLGVEGNRAIYTQLKALAGPPEPVQRVEDVTIPVEEHRIGARVYIPSPGSLPVFVYLHGGGWVGGNLDAFDSPVRALANRSGAAIVSIDYRLAPEHRYPAALEDALGPSAGPSDRVPRRTIGIPVG